MMRTVKNENTSDLSVGMAGESAMVAEENSARVTCVPHETAVDPAVPTERPHADRSSSQLPSLVRCPGYKSTNRGPVHWITQQGLRGHAALDAALDAESPDVLESAYEEHLVAMVEAYVASLPKRGKIYREIKLDTIEGRWGYTDYLSLDDDPRLYHVFAAAARIGVFGTEADLVDYKFVRREIDDAEINLQGIDYCIAVFEKWSHIDTIRVHFPMPRRREITTATFTRDMLPKLKLEVFAILNRAKRTDKKRVPSSCYRPDYEICRFCDRAGTCPALTKLARTIAERYETDPLPGIPAELHPSQTEDPVTLGALKTLANVMEAWAKSVTYHTNVAAFEKGIEVAGYEIDYRKGARTVSDPLALMEVGRKYGLTVESILEAAKISLPKIEKAVKERVEKGKGKAVTAFLDDLRDRDAIESKDETAYLKRKD